MTDDVAQRAPETVLDRMLRAGISEPRARDHLERGVVHVGGEVVSDPATPAPWPTRWVVAAQ